MNNYTIILPLPVYDNDHNITGIDLLVDCFGTTDEDNAKMLLMKKYKYLTYHKLEQATILLNGYMDIKTCSNFEVEYELAFEQLIKK